MANFFEFTQVKAPDVSSTASLMRNAQSSFKDAAMAVTAGADLVRNANIEKDTRIRRDNTAQWANKINSAQSLEEVDALRRELSSDEFKSQYENDFYIDTTQLVQALDARPEAIKTRTTIAEGLKSNEQGEVVSAALLGVETASSGGELDALIQGLRGKGLTVGNSKQIADAVAQKRLTLQNQRTTSLRQQELSTNLRNQQKTEQYNKELINVTTDAMQRFLKSEPSPDDLERSVDSITRSLVDKYGMNPTNVEAAVRSLVINGFNERQQAGINGVVSKLSTDMQGMYLTNVNMLSTVKGEEVYAKQAADISRELFPSAVGQMTSTPASLSDTQKLLTDLQANDVDTALFSELPSELKTEETLGILSSATDTGDFKRAVLKLKSEYGLLQEYNTLMRQNQNSFKASFDSKRSDLSNRLNSNLKAQVRVKEQIANAGSLDTSKLKQELARLHTDFETISSQTQEFLSAPPNAAKDWATTDAGSNKVVAQIGKGLKRDNSVESKQASLAQLMQIYSVTPEQVINMETMPKSVPANAAKLMLKINKELVDGNSGSFNMPDPTGKPIPYNMRY